METDVKSMDATGAGGPMSQVEREIANELINRSPAHLMLLDGAGVIFDINERTERLLKRSAADLRGSKPTHVFAAILARADTIGEERAQRGFQIQHEQAWYEAQVYRALRTPAAPDTDSYVVVRATDVTDRKSAEFQLLESEARLEEATRIAQMGTYKLYWDTMKVIWSHQMYEIHGLAPDSIDPSASRYNELVHPDDLQSVKEMVQSLVSGREVANSEYRIMRGDGRVRWVTVDGRVLFDVGGRPYATFGTVQDVTEIKNREERLRDLVSRNAVLTEALQASPIGVAVVTNQEDESRIFYANAAMEKIFGAEEQKIIGRNLEDFIGEDTDRSEFEVLTDAIRRATHYACEITFNRFDGSSFLGQIAVAPVHAEASKAVIAHTLIITDVTDDRRRTEVMMESQKMEALGKLAGGVAHEINNLLQPIITLSDLGHEATEKDNEKLSQYFDVITRSGRKAREIVRQVLTFSRQDAPAASFHDICALLRDAIQLAESGLPPGITVTQKITVDHAQVLVNPTQLSQVVINLFRNAADAMDNQGDIELALDSMSEQEIAEAHLSAAAHSWLRMRIMDTGSGIEDSARGRIFDPFFTTKPVGQGTGLGLSVVYSIVHGWGGSIDFDSEVDKGTTVMVYIPEHLDV